MDGLDESNALFSPADFGDADDSRPTAAIFDIAGNGSSTPYTNGISGLLLKHIQEMKEKTITTIPGSWKKRIRDFLAEKNTQLLDFLNLSISSHPSLSKGDYVLRKFGSLTMSASSSVKDLVLDASGVDVVSEIDARLLSIREGKGIPDYIAATKLIFDEYTKAGNAALKASDSLRLKLEGLDKIQGKLAGIIDLDTTSSYEPLLQATEAYLGSVYEKNMIEADYKEFIEAYRRFVSLREIVLMMRTHTSTESEPLCMICLNESVSYAFSPCGHTYCNTCVRKQVSNCFLCRGVVRDRVKLFFG
jgi:hypothetical protein